MSLATAEWPTGRFSRGDQPPLQLRPPCADPVQPLLRRPPAGPLLPALTADCRVNPMPPTASETGVRNARLEIRLLLWADHYGGWKVFGCSRGFRLLDGSVLSPDTSLRICAPLSGSGAGVGKPLRLRTARRQRPAPQDGRLLGQWSPPGLAAVGRAALRGTVASPGPLNTLGELHLARIGPLASRVDPRPERALG